MPDAADRDRRHQVWQTLRESAEPLGVAAIARRLAVHSNTIRFHLDALQREGRVEQAAAERVRPGRPAQRFRAVTGMDPAGPRDYLLLARILTESLAGEPDGPARAAAAGRTWGSGLAGGRSNPGPAPVGRLVDLLAALGFEPENPVPDGDLVRLRHCPFLELARHRAAVVCPIHLGLMQGALATWGADVTVDRLTPFAEPDLCTAHLTAEPAA